MEKNSESYQIPIDELISPAQKLVFLKYMQLNNDFIFRPQNYPKLLELLCAEHNKVFCEVTTANILSVMENWVDNVKARFAEMVSLGQSLLFSSEDVELLNLINSEKLKPNSSELSCIIDHLEIAYSSPKVWLTIALEMEAMGSKRDGEYWRKAFEKWCNKVKRKKQILNQMDIDSTELSSFLNSLESRVLDIIDKIEIHQAKKIEYFCRVCLQNKESELKNIYEVHSDGLSLAQKISQCANVQEVIKDDNLPGFICESCHQLLENAYKFKNLCELSDQQLRTLDKNKVEYIEYIIEDGNDEFPSQTMDEDLPNDEAITIEMNLPFDVDLALCDKDTIESEMSAEENTVDKVDKISLKNEISEMHQCEVCGIICYNSATLTKHLNTHTYPRPHRCDICEKVFKTKLSVRIHMRSHTGERPYVCEVCGKAFTQDATLIYHRSIHTGEKRFFCSLCDYRARNVNDLKIHMRKHTGARPYQCYMCLSKFTTSSNLQKHLRRHMGIKNFQTCGKAFKTWSAVTSHRSIHSGVKQFQCPHCPYKGSTKSNLKIHNRTHTGIQPYACDQCPLKFSTASNRHKHIKNVHEKIKAHKCSTCTRSFFSRESARKHMVIHTGLKPYGCEECGMSYGWYNGLQKHMKTQHPGIKMPTEKHFLDLLEK